MSDSATPWTTQSMEFSRPEYWSGQLFPSPGDLPNSGIKPRSPALQADSSPAEPAGKPSLGLWALSHLAVLKLTPGESQIGLSKGLPRPGKLCYQTLLAAPVRLAGALSSRGPACLELPVPARKWPSLLTWKGCWTLEFPSAEGVRQREERNASVLFTRVVIYKLASSHHKLKGRGSFTSGKQRLKANNKSNKKS